MRTWLAETRPYLPPLLAVALSLALATVAVVLLEGPLAVGDASIVYLLAVVVVAGRYGSLAAVVTSFLAFMLYDFLFTEPRFTFAVADAQEWLSLVLFLVVGIVIGRLAALQAARRSEAEARADEAEVAFGIGRALAVEPTVVGAVVGLVEPLRRATGMTRVWLSIGPTPRLERVLADTSPGDMLAPPRLAWLLAPSPDPDATDWIRTHTAMAPGLPADGDERGMSVDTFRVPIVVDGDSVGSVWAWRDRHVALPDRGTTRLLALAADQVGQALRRERLTSEATSAEVARRSDALKSALLDSVSHDLRTPLATIRALAGGLADAELTPTMADVRETATDIDQQAAFLSDAVRDMLDLSRIEAGELRADVEVHALDELVDGVIARRRPTLEGHQLLVALGPRLPPVRVDALLFDHALGNVLENAAQHGGPSAAIRISADVPNDDTDTGPDGAAVDLLVDDDGPGVGSEDLDRLFETFHRGRRSGSGARGLGIGLTVARGMTEAMGGRIIAERSPMGGLRIRIVLPVSLPADGPMDP
ncbi:MAG TPA: DUF4118 domain-containing protein [Candidatus Limnocylindrales bacterium]|jgi:two-component system sensor histidine kinase KdpD